MVEQAQSFVLALSRKLTKYNNVQRSFLLLTFVSCNALCTYHTYSEAFLAETTPDETQKATKRLHQTHLRTV